LDIIVNFGDPVQLAGAANQVVLPSWMFGFVNLVGGDEDGQ
jgi:hypothetical protein